MSQIHIFLLAREVKASLSSFSVSYHDLLCSTLFCFFEQVNPLRLMSSAVSGHRRSYSSYDTAAIAIFINIVFSYLFANSLK